MTIEPGPKAFPVGDVLSVTTGILVGPSHIDGIYAVCDHMEQYPHFTHALGEAAERIRPAILRQAPELAEAFPPPISSEDEASAWCSSVCDYIGKTEIVLVPVGSPAG